MAGKEQNFTEQINVKLSKKTMRQLDAEIARLKKEDEAFSGQYTRAFLVRVLVIRGLSQLETKQTHMSDRAPQRK
jgi:hypothetical protein